MQKVLALVAVLAVGVAASGDCPGSPAPFHASCQLRATATTNCTAVLSEIKDRGAGVNGWVDPHNGGHYQNMQVDGMTVNGEHVTGAAPHYVDKYRLILSPHGSDGCTIEACSESQVASILDGSTNYCNVHNIYCGQNQGCKASTYRYNTSESFTHCSQNDIKKCS